ncbi:DDE superfamily endonuclease-domain-containing protein [Schizophyllum commune]
MSSENKGGRPYGSAGQKRSREQRIREENIQDAVTDVKDEDMSYRKAGDAHNVASSTIWHRVHGRPTRRGAAAVRQRLSPAEEGEIEHLGRELDRFDLHLTMKSLRRKISAVLVAKGDTAPLGQNFINKFLSRHPDMKTALASRKEAARRAAENDPIEETDRDYDIQPENSYTMDETGFLLGVSWRDHVIIFRRRDADGKDLETSGERSRLTGQNRELVTCIECICADGTALDVFIIMKGQYPNFGWTKYSLLKNGWVASSPSGWMDNYLACEWLKQCFDPLTRDKANGRWRRLIFDNHESHVSFEFIKEALDRKIVCVGLPPKTSGIMAPLDVGVFASYKRAYQQAVSEEIDAGVAITKQDFCRILPKARVVAFTRARIVDAFERTGIYPFNRKALDVMRKYYQQSYTSTSDPAPSTPPPNPNPDPLKPSAALAHLKDLEQNPGSTPTKATRIAHELADELEHTRTRTVLQYDRIRELNQHEAGRSKKVDKRRPDEDSRVFNINRLNEMRIERDRKDAEKAAMRVEVAVRPLARRDESYFIFLGLIAFTLPI